MKCLYSIIFFIVSSCFSQDNLESFSNEALEVSSNNVILIDEYLENAKEIDVDIIRDKNINSLFLSVLNNKLRIECKILKVYHKLAATVYLQL